MANQRTERLCHRIQAQNPGIRIVRGTSHLKIMKDGRLIAILPYRLAKEGLAQNTRAQFRRWGIHC